MRGEEKEDGRKIHVDPPIGAPRYDLRKYLDPEIKQETNEGVKEPMDVVTEKKKQKHPLLPGRLALQLP